jgi:hypothetical protein
MADFGRATKEYGVCSIHPQPGRAVASCIVYSVLGTAYFALLHPSPLFLRPQSPIPNP